MIRKTAVAGGFYPSDKKGLEKMVSGFIANAPDRKIKNLRGIIVPHAGYIYSGPVAGHAYRQLQGLPEKKYNVFLLGPAHFIYTTASIGLFEKFETPLGPVKVNMEICRKLSKNSIFDLSTKAHLPEHSLEVQLPFLQKSLKEFEIVPILIGEAAPQTISEILSPYFGKDRNIFVFSSDLSHYLPYEKANRTDAHSLKIITEGLLENENEIDACGNLGIRVAMRLAGENNCRIMLLDHRNSGDTAGERDAVVGYASLAIY